MTYLLSESSSDIELQWTLNQQEVIILLPVVPDFVEVLEMALGGEISCQKA